MRYGLEDASFRAFNTPDNLRRSLLAKVGKRLRREYTETSRWIGFWGRRTKCHGVSEQSIYGWHERFAGMAAEDVKDRKNLTQENVRLKKLLADRDFEIEILREITTKK